MLQVPQRLLGPSPFPLDRLIALLGALLEEHDVESRLPAPELVEDFLELIVATLGWLNETTEGWPPR